MRGKSTAASSMAVTNASSVSRAASGGIAVGSDAADATDGRGAGSAINAAKLADARLMGSGATGAVAAGNAATVFVAETASCAFRTSCNSETLSKGSPLSLAHNTPREDKRTQNLLGAPSSLNAMRKSPVPKDRGGEAINLRCGEEPRRPARQRRHER